MAGSSTKADASRPMAPTSTTVARAHHIRLTTSSRPSDTQNQPTGSVVKGSFAVMAIG